MARMIVWNDNDKTSSGVVIESMGLDVTLNGTWYSAVRATEAEKQGKWYYEVTVNQLWSGVVGFTSKGRALSYEGNWIGSHADDYVFAFNSGKIWNNGVEIQTLNKIEEGQTVGVFYDNKKNIIQFYVEGQKIGEPININISNPAPVVGKALYGENTIKLSGNFGTSQFNIERTNPDEWERLIGEGVKPYDTSSKPDVPNLGDRGDIEFIYYDESSGRDSIESLVDGMVNKHGWYGVLLSSYGASYIEFELKQRSNLWSFGQHYSDSGGRTPRPVSLSYKKDGVWVILEPRIETKTDEWYLLGTGLQAGQYKVKVDGRYTMFTEWYVEKLEEYTFLIEQAGSYYSIEESNYNIGKYNPLILSGGSKPNKVDFIKFGFKKLNDLFKVVEQASVRNSCQASYGGNFCSSAFDKNFNYFNPYQFLGGETKWGELLTKDLPKDNFQASRYHSGRYDYTPDRAFDGHTDNNEYTGFQVKNPVPTDWLTVKFAEAVNPSKITIQANDGSAGSLTYADYLPKRIRVSMSDTGEEGTYVVIGEINDIIKDTNVNTYVIPTPSKKYQYLKMEFLEFYNKDWMTINQMGIFENTDETYNLLQDVEGVNYTITEGELQELNETTINEELFKTQGFEEIGLVTHQLLTDNSINLEDIRLLTWTNNETYTDLLLNYTLQPNKRPINFIGERNNGLFNIVMVVE